MRFIGADGSLGFRKNSVYTIQIIHTITVFGEMVRIDNVEDFKMRCEYRSYDRFLENWEDLKFKSEKVKEEWVELYKIAFIPKANDVKDYKLEEARHNAIIGFIHTQRSLAQQEGYEQCKKELLANRDARCDDCKAVGYSSCSNCESKVDPLLKIEKKITQQEILDRVMEIKPKRKVFVPNIGFAGLTMLESGFNNAVDEFDEKLSTLKDTNI